MSHVKDSDSFHLPCGVNIHIPQVLEPIGLELTKFMVLELVVAVLIIVVFVPLAWKISTGERPRGRLWNFLEIMLLFLRDEVARPAIGRRDADRFMPFMWTVFLFVLAQGLCFIAENTNPTTLQKKLEQIETTN